jgi:hypothetical protein
MTAYVLAYTFVHSCIAEHLLHNADMHMQDSNATYTHILCCCAAMQAITQ